MLIKLVCHHIILLFSTGPMELKVIYEKCGVQSIHFSVELDSVYRTPEGEMVYSLERVEMETRNIWQLLIIVELIDSFQGKFLSKEFRIRTRPKPPPMQAAGTCALIHNFVY